MRLGWLLFGVATACGGAAVTDVPPVAYKGALPASVSARYIFNVLSVEASANGAAARRLLVDTGSPMTGVDPSSWTDAQIPADLSALSTLTVGSLTFEQVPSVPLSECGGNCSPFDVTGVVGGNILRSFVVAFDYRAPTVAFGSTAVPASAQATPIVIPFTVAGGGSGMIAGGDGQVVDVPPTRLVLHASIDGTARTLVLDTGSSYTLLRQSLFTPAVADGRGQITLEASTTSGTAEGAVARTRSIDVGAATTAGNPIASVPDSLVDDVASETGETIDGMLGGAFLRGFYAVIDYAGGKLSLYPYNAADPLADEFDRAGVFLIESDGGYAVVQATDPAAQSLVGAVLADVDGTVVAGLDPEQADRLLRGQPGATHTLHVGGPGGLEATTLTVKDVIPLVP